jgi:enoyl-[acyl-carrier protein] reductase I
VRVCDVEKQAEIDALARELERRGVKLDGFVHSIAFASYTPTEAGTAPAFHETSRKDFLRAIDVSCFSLIAMANAVKDSFTPGACVVAISISTTRMAAENYGAMALVKAALDSAIVFLAKSFAEAAVRFNAVGAGPPKTASSAASRATSRATSTPSPRRCGNARSRPARSPMRRSSSFLRDPRASTRRRS